MFVYNQPTPWPSYQAPHRKLCANQKASCPIKLHLIVHNNVHIVSAYHKKLCRWFLVYLSLKTPTSFLRRFTLFSSSAPKPNTLVLRSRGYRRPYSLISWIIWREHAQHHAWALGHPYSPTDAFSLPSPPPPPTRPLDSHNNRPWQVWTNWCQSPRGEGNFKKFCTRPYLDFYIICQFAVVRGNTWTLH